MQDIIRSGQGRGFCIYEYGHGHVYPRADHIKLDCGGITACFQCMQEDAHLVEMREEAIAEREQGRWYGVDLDETLAEFGGWVDDYSVGPPIEAMANRVRCWLIQGRDIRIFTARAHPMGYEENGRDFAPAIPAIQDWTEKHFGVRLPVTCMKDFRMIALWDDRAVSVKPGTGQRADGRMDMSSRP